MTIYPVLSIIGFFIKLWVTHNVFFKHTIKDRSLHVQTVVAAAIFISYSLPQFLLQAPDSYGQILGLARYEVLRIYYFHGSLCLISGLYCSLSLLEFKFHKGWLLKIGLLIYFFVGGYYQLFTSWLVFEGAVRQPFSVELSSGQGFEYVLMTRVAVIVLVVGAMLRFYQRYQLAKSHDIQIASVHAIAFSFLFLVNSLLALFIVHPLFFATRGLFFFVAMALITRDKPVYDGRTITPATQENRVSKEVVRVFSKYANDEIGHREAIKTVEQLFVTYKLSKVTKFRSASGSSLPAVADSMQISLSSLYDIIRRLELEKPKS